MEDTEQLSVKQDKIDSLNGLKAIAMVAIFLWHSVLSGFYIDLGARACELFFIISGFLVGYNHFYKILDATWAGSFKYVLKKLYRFWPLHFFVTVLLLIFDIRSFSVVDLYKCLISLSMLQAWSSNSEIFFAVNGVMWFLSALMFCYFLSPVLLKLIKKGIHFSVVFFIIVFCVRFSIDLFISMYPGILSINTHVSPVVRCMEYLMGMLMVPCFMCIKDWADKLAKNKVMILFSLIEIPVLSGILYLLICHTGLSRSVFVLAFCPVVFVFALNKGIVSRCLSIKPFKWFSMIQLEFFILHQAMMRLFHYMDFIGNGNLWIQGSTMFAVVVITAASYHVLLTDRLADLMEKKTAAGA